MCDLLVSMIWRPETDSIFTDLERGPEDSSAPHTLSSTLMWFGFLLILSILFGFIIALSIFFLAFFQLRAKVSWKQTIILSVCEFRHLFSWWYSWS